MAKKPIILLVVAVFLLFAMLFGVLIFTKIEKDRKIKKEREAIEAQKKELTLKSEEFAGVWGTYTYTEYPDKYTENLKSFISSSFYSKLIGQKKDMGYAKSVDFIRKQQQNSETKPIKVMSIDQTETGYLAKILVKTKLSDKNRSIEKEKTLVLEWEKEGGEYRVFDARFEF